MNTSGMETDPGLDMLPVEGKVEYLRWSETYHRLTTSYLAGVEKLREIKVLDPARAGLYDREIESLLRKASDAMEEWQGHRRRILGTWLSGTERNLDFLVEK